MLRSALRSLRPLPRLAAASCKSGASRVKSTTSTAATGDTSFARRMMDAYEGALEARPILTKSVTSGVLYGVGDCVAQGFERRSNPEHRFDTARLWRATAYGGLFYPFLAHLHYNFLENLVVVRWAVAPSRVPWVKMFIEQFVYWSYFTNAYYHAVLGALQGMNPSQVYDRVAATLWDTLKAQVRARDWRRVESSPSAASVHVPTARSRCAHAHALPLSRALAQWAFWIPAQLINFRFVPVRHQLNFVLVVSLGWTTFLSLAFPPEPVKALASSSSSSSSSSSKTKDEP